MDKQKRFLVIQTIFLLVIIFATDIATGAIAMASGPLISPFTCQSNNSLCNNQISYVTSVSGNNTGIGTVTTSSWSAVSNQSMIVVAGVGASATGLHTMVSNLTDTLGDTFARKLIQQFAPGSIEGNNIEIWFGQTSSSGTNALTAKWNFTDGQGTQILQANIYTGVSGTGSTNSTSTTGAVASLTISPRKNGSWIFGAVNIAFPVCPPPAIGASPSFIRRIDTCQVVNGAGVNEAESSDNATALRNTFKITYAPTGAGTQNDYAVIELVAIDSESLLPDFSNTCTITPFNCSTRLNAVSVNTVPNALNKALPLNTAFCTGITTTALTTTTGKIFVWAAYSADDLNTTSAKIFLQLYISTNVPTTAFASGLCASGGSIIATGSIQFPLTGALSLTNTFSTALNGVDTITGTSPAANTYYGWLEVTAQGFISGSLGIDQLCTNTSFGICTLNMMEIK